MNNPRTDYFLENSSELLLLNFKSFNLMCLHIVQMIQNLTKGTSGTILYQIRSSIEIPCSALSHHIEQWWLNANCDKEQMAGKFESKWNNVHWSESIWQLSVILPGSIAFRSRHCRQIIVCGRPCNENLYSCLLLMMLKCCRGLVSSYINPSNHLLHVSHDVINSPCDRSRTLCPIADVSVTPHLRMDVCMRAFVNTPIHWYMYIWMN